ncbi:hypothetical protein DIPPA_09718 [Diplonema papillatum]|nr:hypothetical protein DIPPA_09718 [Diplonema papillatum]
MFGGELPAPGGSSISRKGTDNMRRDFWTEWSSTSAPRMTQSVYMESQRTLASHASGLTQPVHRQPSYGLNLEQEDVQIQRVLTPLEPDLTPPLTAFDDPFSKARNGRTGHPKEVRSNSSASARSKASDSRRVDEFPRSVSAGARRKPGIPFMPQSSLLHTRNSSSNASSKPRRMSSSPRPRTLPFDVAVRSTAHQVSPPPKTCPARLGTHLTAQHEQLLADPGRMILTLKIDGLGGTCDTVRYVSKDGLRWASTYINNGGVPVSEARRFSYDPATRTLTDQHGFGGVLTNAAPAALEATLDNLSAFAFAACIPHDLPRGSSQERQPSRSSKSKHSWDSFTNWLYGDTEDTWGHAHRDVKTEPTRVVVGPHATFSDGAPRNAAGAREVSKGTADWDVAVLGGTGMCIGVVRKECFHEGRDLLRVEDAFVYSDQGEVWKGGSELMGAEPYAVGDVITVHLDMNRGTVSWSKNGNRQAARFAQLCGTYQLVVGMTTSGTALDVVSASIRPGKALSESSTPRHESQSEDRSATERQRSLSNGAAKRQLSVSLQTGFGSTSGTVVGPADLHLPPGSVATLHADAGELVLQVTRIKPSWTPALPQCSDTTEPSRALSPRIRDVFRGNGQIVL